MILCENTINIAINIECKGKHEIRVRMARLIQRGFLVQDPSGFKFLCITYNSNVCYLNALSVLNLCGNSVIQYTMVVNSFEQYKYTFLT